MVCAWAEAAVDQLQTTHLGLFSFPPSLACRIQSIIPVLEQVLKTQRPLLIVSEDVESGELGHTESAVCAVPAAHAGQRLAQAVGLWCAGPSVPR